MEKIYKDVKTTGSDVIPPPKPIDSLKLIMKSSPPNKCYPWSVFAYVLNKDMLNPDGTLDDLHGIIFPLGSFKTEKKAFSHCEKVIRDTGHPAVVACNYGKPFRLTSNINELNTEKIYVDDTGKIQKFQDDINKQQRETYEKRKRVEKEITEEANLETDESSIEYFKRQCYLAIKNKARLEHSAKELCESFDCFTKRKDNAYKHYLKFPEHEKEWLPLLKERLDQRGESELYKYIEFGYKSLRQEILNEQSDDLVDLVKPYAQNNSILDHLVKEILSLRSQVSALKNPDP